MLLKIREAKEQVECHRCGVFWLSGKLARVEQKVHSLRDKVKEFAKRGDINAIAYNIAKAYKDGKLKEKAGLMNILDTMSKNLCKKNNEKRYSATTKDFYEVLLTMGGPRLCDFIAQNLDGPHVHSATVWRNEHAITYVLGRHKQNIEAIAKLYRNAKYMMSISTTPVPYIKAEDKTAIIPRPDYKWDTDEVWGFCEKKGPRHICEESFVVKVGDDDGAYQCLFEAFQNCQVATHARVIMINPLHLKLPRVVLLLQANCGLHTVKFSTNGLYLTHFVKAF